jgi:hypothetical protein
MHKFPVEFLHANEEHWSIQSFAHPLWLELRWAHFRKEHVPESLHHVLKKIYLNLQICYGFGYTSLPDALIQQIELGI